MQYRKKEREEKTKSSNIAKVYENILSMLSSFCCENYTSGN